MVRGYLLRTGTVFRECGVVYNNISVREDGSAPTDTFITHGSFAPRVKVACGAIISKDGIAYFQFTFSVYRTSQNRGVFFKSASTNDQSSTFVEDSTTSALNAVAAHWISDSFIIVFNLALGEIPSKSAIRNGHISKTFI